MRHKDDFLSRFVNEDLPDLMRELLIGSSDAAPRFDDELTQLVMEFKSGYIRRCKALGLMPEETQMLHGLTIEDLHYLMNSPVSVLTFLIHHENLPLILQQARREQRRLQRIERALALNSDGINIVAINDLTDSKTLAHLLKHDSLMGKLAADVEAGESELRIDGKAVRVFSKRDPSNIRWRDVGVDIVIEATGFFTERDNAVVHITHGGAKRVIISAPGKDDDLTVVMSVNDHCYDPQQHFVVSNGSCTTNGLAPAALVLHQAFGIEHGLMNTKHVYTNSQALHDQPEKDLRGARATALFIVPYSSGAAKAPGRAD